MRRRLGWRLHGHAHQRRPLFASHAYRPPHDGLSARNTNVLLLVVWVQLSIQPQLRCPVEDGRDLEAATLRATCHAQPLLRRHRLHLGSRSSAGGPQVLDRRHVEHVDVHVPNTGERQTRVTNNPLNLRRSRRYSQHCSHICNLQNIRRRRANTEADRNAGAVDRNYGRQQRRCEPRISDNPGDSIR